MAIYYIDKCISVSLLTIFTEDMDKFGARRFFFSQKSTFRGSLLTEKWWDCFNFSIRNKDANQQKLFEIITIIFLPNSYGHRNVFCIEDDLIPEKGVSFTWIRRIFTSFLVEMYRKIRTKFEQKVLKYETYNWSFAWKWSDRIENCIGLPILNRIAG